MKHRRRAIYNATIHVCYIKDGGTCTCKNMHFGCLKYCYACRGTLFQVVENAVARCLPHGNFQKLAGMMKWLCLDSCMFDFLCVLAL